MSNPKDPLLKSGPDYQRLLFDRLSKAADGFQGDEVINAAANIIINVLRQTHTTRDAAEKRFDELFGRTKTILLDHYDQLGRKRGIFPFDQTIVVPRFV